LASIEQPNAKLAKRGKAEDSAPPLRTLTVYSGLQRRSCLPNLQQISTDDLISQGTFPLSTGSTLVYKETPASAQCAPQPARALGINVPGKPSLCFRTRRYDNGNWVRPRAQHFVIGRSDSGKRQLEPSADRQSKAPYLSPVKMRRPSTRSRTATTRSCRVRKKKAGPLSVRHSGKGMVGVVLLAMAPVSGSTRARLLVAPNLATRRTLVYQAR
jgi:hypothetical protein